MNTINPTVAEIDAAVNVLAILEMAKDAGKLKAALQEVKDAQAAAATERAEADKALASLKAVEASLERDRALLEQERAKLKEESARVFKASGDVELDRAAMREERNNFDRWMAGEREAIAAARAKADSDAVANQRRAEEIASVEESAAARVRDAEAAIRAADAKRAEYEAKIDSLKKMVN